MTGLLHRYKLTVVFASSSAHKGLLNRVQGRNLGQFFPSHFPYIDVAFYRSISLLLLFSFALAFLQRLSFCYFFKIEIAVKIIELNRIDLLSEIF
jgi:hypothetical protein